MKRVTGFKCDTGFKIGVAQTLSARQSGIFLPLGGAGGGGEYGETINDEARAFAITREPIAHRMTFTVAHDIFDNWFNLKLKKAKPEDSETFDQKVQSALSGLHTKRELTRMAVFERAFGWALTAYGYVDDTDLNEPLSDSPEDLVQIKTYCPLQVQHVTLDREKETADGLPNLHYGYPEIFSVKPKGSISSVKIHYSKTNLWATRFTGQEADEWKGTSALDPVWDDLVTLRNERWSMGQTMYRTGSGFFDITLKDFEQAAIDEYIAQGYFDSLSERTYFAHHQDQTLDIKGFQGKALNPEQYYLPVMENISCGTMIPLAILRGAQAGALVGSETNLKEYFKIVTNWQQGYEDGTRDLVNRIITVKKIAPEQPNYVFDWNAPFVLTETEKVDLEYKRMQILQIKGNWMTKDEIRKLMDPNLEDLPEGQGGKELASKSVIPSGSSAYTVIEHAREDHSS